MSRWEKDGGRRTEDGGEGFEAENVAAMRAESEVVEEVSSAPNKNLTSEPELGAAASEAETLKEVVAVGEELKSAFNDAARADWWGLSADWDAGCRRREWFGGDRGGDHGARAAAAADFLTLFGPIWSVQESPGVGPALGVRTKRAVWGDGMRWKSVRAEWSIDEPGSIVKAHKRESPAEVG